MIESLTSDNAGYGKESMMNEKQRKSVETLTSMCHDTLVGKGVDASTFTSNLRLFADYMDAASEGGIDYESQRKATDEQE